MLTWPTVNKSLTPLLYMMLSTVTLCVCVSTAHLCVFACAHREREWSILGERIAGDCRRRQTVEGKVSVSFLGHIAETLAAHSQLQRCQAAWFWHTHTHTHTQARTLEPWQSIAGNRIVKEEKLCLLSSSVTGGACPCSRGPTLSTVDVDKCLNVFFEPFKLPLKPSVLLSSFG